MTNKFVVLASAPFTIFTGLVLLGFDLTEKDQLRFVLTLVFFVTLIICTSAFGRWYKYDRVKQEDTEQD